MTCSNKGPCSDNQWFVLSKDDPEEEEGVCQPNPCDIGKVELGGICRKIGFFNGCNGAPIAVHVNLFGEPTCKCPCHCRYKCTEDHNVNLPALSNTSFCPDPFKPNLEFLDPECFSKYNSATKFQANPQLVNDLGSRTCNEDQVLAQNERCYAQDMQVRSASFSTEVAATYTEYIRRAGFMKTDSLYKFH